MLTGKKLMINDLEIDGINEIDVTVLKCLTEKGIEVTQDLEKELISVNYSPTADDIFVKDEEKDVVIISSEKFDNLFKEILMLLFEEAIAKFESNKELDEEILMAEEILNAEKILNSEEILNAEEITLDTSECKYDPELVSIEIIEEPAAKPGIFRQFTNGCAYYFNSGYESVFGKSKTTEPEEKSSPKPMP